MVGDERRGDAGRPPVGGVSRPPGPAVAAVPPRTSAVLDIGSHSVLLLVVAVGDDGRSRPLDEALVTTRLGEGLVAGRALAPLAAARTRDAVVSLVGRARAAGATAVWAFATAAVRDAGDGAAWADGVARAAGVEVDVLTGAREAALAWAATRTLRPDDRPGIGADLGGRTLELTCGTAGVAAEAAEAVSLPLGALVLTERHLRDDPPGASARCALADAVDAQLARAPLVAAARGAALVVSGGTATTLAALDLGLVRYDPGRVHGHRLARREVEAAVERLCGVPLRTRATLCGLDPGRAAVLPAGAIVLARLLGALDAPELRVSDHGVRHAYLAERLAARGAPVGRDAPWR
jgi:exopolyphosphatase / guanosine-5'-triphosphate,3'-diphosphate pyrophosphatase